MNLLETIFRTVLDISWRSSWLVLAVFALRVLLRGRLPARVMFWAWIAVAIRLLLPFAVPAAWSPFNFAPITQRPDSEIAYGPTAASPQPADAQAASLARAATAALSSHPVSHEKKLTPAQWTALVWGAGVVALVLARLWAYGCFVRALRRSRTALDPTTASLLAEASSEPGFDRIKISVTNVVAAPVLHGIFRPQLLFPPGFVEKLTPRELRLIVAHELAHIRRRDLLAQVLIHGAVILHWFNPLAWLAARLARADCELACDESVLRRLTATERESYGATLLKIIRLARCSAPPPLGLGVVESKQQIKRRIQMIVTQHSSTVARTLLGCALFALVTGLSLTSEIQAQPAPAVTESRVEPPRKVITGLETQAQVLSLRLQGGVIDSFGKSNQEYPQKNADGSLATDATGKQLFFKPGVAYYNKFYLGGPTTLRGFDPSQWKFAYDASTDRLDTMFSNGIVAVVGDKIIKTEDVRREMKPLVPLLQREARDQEDFNLRLNRQQNLVIKELIARVLYIKEFNAPRPGEDAKSIPSEYVDNEIADRLHDQFDNDRSKFLAYLRSRGTTIREFRREVEEEIIVHYMLGQERKLTAVADANKAKPDGAPGKIHMRMIQLMRTPEITDAALLEKANVILARFKNGESFYALAREFSNGGNRAKGGDWGWQSPSDLLPVYSEKLFALQKGEVSAPIVIPEGCFLLYAEDRK